MHAKKCQCPVQSGIRKHAPDCRVYREWAKEMERLHEKYGKRKKTEYMGESKLALIMERYGSEDDSLNNQGPKM